MRGPVCPTLSRTWHLVAYIRTTWLGESTAVRPWEGSCGAAYIFVANLGFMQFMASCSHEGEAVRFHTILVSLYNIIGPRCHLPQLIVTLELFLPHCGGPTHPSALCGLNVVINSCSRVLTADCLRSYGRGGGRNLCRATALWCPVLGIRICMGGLFQGAG